MQADARLLRPKHPLTNLALIPSWECDVACHHCVFSSSPRVKGRLDPVIASRLIAELKDCSTLERVTVSGGEAFLDVAFLLQIAQACKASSLALRVITNGSFATSLDETVDVLSALTDAGLDSIGLSWDQFHSQFIDATRVVNLIRACRRLGVPIQMTCVVTRQSTLSEALASLGDEGFELKTVQVKCLPIGRAARKVSPEELLPPSEWERGRACRSDFDTLSIIHDGGIYPCCAVGGFTDPLRLGVYPRDRIEDLLNRRRDEPLWSILAAQGPKYFIAQATPSERTKMGVSEVVHDCVNCNRLFSSQLGQELVKRATLKLESAARNVFDQLSLKADNT